MFGEAEAASRIDAVAGESAAFSPARVGGAGATFFTRDPDGILDSTRVRVDEVFSGPAPWFGLAVWLLGSKDKGAASAFAGGEVTSFVVGGA